MATIGTRGWWAVDRDVKLIGTTILVALSFGVVFTYLSVDVASSATRQGAVPPPPVAAPTALQVAERQSLAPGNAQAATGSPAPGAGNDAAPASRGAGNAMRWTALLWAFACCAVGGFLGFIFGIPRSLSSDTARNIVPIKNPALDNARNKLTASTVAANDAVTEYDQAARAAQEVDKELAMKTPDVERLAAKAAHAPEDAAAFKDAEKAQKELADLHKKKMALDSVALGKLKVAQNAQELARKDQESLAVMTREQAASQTDTPSRAGPSTTVNTNLEQISDWLTKIIVGVSLVNSDQIGNALWRAAGSMADSIGGKDSQSLALAILVYFSVLGVLGGYLLTRLFLQRAFDSVGVYEPVI